MFTYKNIKSVHKLQKKSIFLLWRLHRTLCIQNEENLKNKENSFIDVKLVILSIFLNCVWSIFIEKNMILQFTKIATIIIVNFLMKMNTVTFSYN